MKTRKRLALIVLCHVVVLSDPLWALDVERLMNTHFEPFANEFKIRYRVDGALYEMTPPPKRLAMPIISRIKVMSNLNIAERRLPQDGRIELRIANKQAAPQLIRVPVAAPEDARQ